MRIRNLTAKPIGFGSTIVLPDQIAEIPKGYDINHPIVKYYFSRNWIAEVGAKGSVAAAPIEGLSVNVNAGVNPSTAVADSSPAPESKSLESKSLDRMNKDELQALAFAQGIVFAETDTKQVLIDKIKAAKDTSA